MNELSNTLLASERHYVRCLKPNEEKTPNIFDEDKVVHQLRWLVFYFFLITILTVYSVMELLTQFQFLKLATQPNFYQKYFITGFVCNN